MRRTITVEGWRYLIRGPYTGRDLLRLFADFLTKYPTTTLSFRRWLVERGKVYKRIKEEG